MKKALLRLLNFAGLDLLRSSGDYPLGKFWARRELRRLASAPDFSVVETDILGPKLSLVSNRAFAYLYTEIMGREIYRFNSPHSKPYVLDCGANIGVSCIYFKRLFPEASVVSFEPDPSTFRILDANVRRFGLDGVELINKGVWSFEGELSFQEDPQSTAGRIVEAGEGSKVQVVRLRDYLNRRIDMLKIDIEGAEHVVLPDIKDRLQQVDNLFLEFHERPHDDPSAFVRALHILADSGFRLYIETGPSTARNPFISRSTYKGISMLVNIFATRAKHSS
jgi:FkbM family methyltransferase